MQCLGILWHNPCSTGHISASAREAQAEGTGKRKFEWSWWTSSQGMLQEILAPDPWGWTEHYFFPSFAKLTLSETKFSSRKSQTCPIYLRFFCSGISPKAHHPQFQPSQIFALIQRRALGSSNSGGVAKHMLPSQHSPWPPRTQQRSSSSITPRLSFLICKLVELNFALWGSSYGTNLNLLIETVGFTKKSVSLLQI